MMNQALYAHMNNKRKRKKKRAQGQPELYSETLSKNKINK
jgi:hypothetical protein